MTISLTSFPGIPDSVAAARRFVTGMLRLCPQTSAPDEVVHRVELIVSELCTNAIRHTRSGDPGQKFHVHVCTDERGVHVEVRTLPPRRPRSVPRVVPPEDPFSEHGRGMFLVDQWATQWGTLSPRENGVYFLLVWEPSD